MKTLIFNIFMFFTHIESHEDVVVYSAKDAIVHTSKDAIDHTSKDAIEIEVVAPDILDRMYLEPPQVFPKPIRPLPVTRVNP